jgi:Flp pilus assembly protein TadD
MSSTTLRLFFSLILAVAFTIATRAQTPVQESPLTTSQLVEQGNKFASERQYDRAVDAFRRAIKLNPNLAEAYHGLGRVYVDMGRPSDALVPLQTAVRLEPDNALAHVNLAITLENLRRFDDALLELNEAKRLNPRDATIHNELGNLLNNYLGRAPDALAAYQEARRLDPSQPEIQHNVGLALMEAGKFAEAIAPLKDALRLNPQYRNARYLLSDAYGRLGRYEEAAASWTKFLELVPNGPDALTKRMWSYLYLGGHEREAALDARQYIDTQGWSGQVSTFMVIIANLAYRGSGMDQEARSILDEGAAKTNAMVWPYPIVRYLQGEISADELIQQASDNNKKTEAHAYLGLALRINGNRDEARAHFNWVRDYGNKRYYEYPFAIEELKRLGR